MATNGKTRGPKDNKTVNKSAREPKKSATKQKRVAKQLGSAKKT
jgi:hypothetical protein